MDSSKITPAIAFIISLALLIPGISQPLITLKAEMNRQAVVTEGKKMLDQQQLHPAIKTMAGQFLDGLKVEGSSEVYNKTRSILGTAEDLWNVGYKLVAILILTFSIVIPAIKSMLLLGATFSDRRQQLLSINAIVGKWSMADVFAMGVLIAVLAANAVPSESATLNFQAELHSGFYWFLAYCLTSGVAAQLLLRQPLMESTDN